MPNMIQIHCICWASEEGEEDEEDEEADDAEDDEDDEEEAPKKASKPTGKLAAAKKRPRKIKGE